MRRCHSPPPTAPNGTFATEADRRAYARKAMMAGGMKLEQDRQVEDKKKAEKEKDKAGKKKPAVKATSKKKTKYDDWKPPEDDMGF